MLSTPEIESWVFISLVKHAAQESQTQVATGALQRTRISKTDQIYKAKGVVETVRCPKGAAVAQVQLPVARKAHFHPFPTTPHPKLSRLSQSVC